MHVVGYSSDTVYQLDPDSGEFRLLLDKKDGLIAPYSVSYCDIEDKINVGMVTSSCLKMFDMK